MNVKWVEYKSRDNIALEALLMEPDYKQTACLLFLHGITDNIRRPDWAKKIGERIVDSGIAFCAINDRGHDQDVELLRGIAGATEKVRGGSSYFVFDDTEFDISGALSMLYGIGYRQIVIGGHSLGSNKSAAYLLKHPEDSNIKGAIWLSPVDNAAIGNTKLLPQFPAFIRFAEEELQKGNSEKLMPADAMFMPMSVATYFSLFNPNSNAGLFQFHDENFEFKHLNYIQKPIIGTLATEMEWSLVNRGEHHETDKAVKSIQNRYHNKDFVIYKINGAPHTYEGYEKELTDIINPWLSRLLNN